MRVVEACERLREVIRTYGDIPVTIPKVMGGMLASQLLDDLSKHELFNAIVSDRNLNELVRIKVINLGGRIPLESRNFLVLYFSENSTK